LGISHHDIHVLDKFIRPFGSSVFVLILAITSALIGIYLSQRYCDWTWFSRFGSVITVAGLLLVSSPIFDQGVYLSHASAFGFGSKDEHGDSRITDETSRKMGNKVLIGIVVSICGTLVWGFGDLIEKLSAC
jgi:hypothetical protein|tara:strand:- start:2126 stop:2521 length:396 start_codon:yes stop_codon:yes gene_type:complete